MDSCCCYDDDYDGPEVATYDMVTARKSHECCECGEIIDPGDTYERIKGLWDGEWNEFKTCELCRRIGDDLFPCGYLYGGLSEALLNCYDVELR